MLTLGSKITLFSHFWNNKTSKKIKNGHVYPLLTVCYQVQFQKKANDKI